MSNRTIISNNESFVKYDFCLTPTLAIDNNNSIVYHNQIFERLILFSDHQKTSDIKIEASFNQCKFDNFTHAVATLEIGNSLKITFSSACGNKLITHGVFTLLDVIYDKENIISVGHVRLLTPENLFNENMMLKSLITFATDAIYIVNPDSSAIISGNHSSFKRLNYSYNELTSLKVININKNINSIEKWIRLSKKIKKKGSLLVETEHVKKDGDTIKVEVNISTAYFFNNNYFIAIARDITKRKKKENSRLCAANIDELTKLPNRRLFNKKLAKLAKNSKRNNSYISILYVDLDNFKEINDYYGHEFGDKVLKAVAARFKNSIRPNDYIARIGGDEFVIIFANVMDSTHAKSLVNKIESIFVQPFIINGVAKTIYASIGVSTFIANSHECANEVHQADMAMYQAKKQKGTSAVYHLTNTT